MNWAQSYRAVSPPDYLPVYPVRLPKLDVPDFFLDSYQAEWLSIPAYWEGVLEPGDPVLVDYWADRREAMLAAALASLPRELSIELDCWMIPAQLISGFVV